MTSAPPSLMKSLMAGFDVVSKHISLIVFSVALDLLLWFGPQVHLVRLFEPVLEEAASIPEMRSAGSIDLLRAGAERLNLISVMRSFPVGIPSLMAGRSPVDTPLAQNPVSLDLASFWFAAGLWGVLILMGVGVGTLYFSMVAQAALFDRLDLRQALADWPRNFGHVLMLTAFWFVLIALFMLPLSCLLSILLLFGMGVAQFPLLIALFLGGIIIWLLIPLFFSPHGIFASGRPMWESILQGIRLSRSTFSTTGFLILAVIVFGEGMNILWNTPAEDSWFLLVGIFGHAFITAGLLSATFVYYRDADLWLKEILSLRQAHRV